MRLIRYDIVLKYLKKIFFTGCCLIGTGLSYAQLNTSAFEDFTQVYVNPYIINPAANDTSYTYKLMANNITELGLFQNVRRFYFNADRRIKTSEKGKYHFIGAQLSNYRLGDFISKNRVHLRYSWVFPLSRKSTLASGVSLGFINYAFLTTKGGSGGTDYGPDGSIGLHYLRNKTTIGISMQQIFTTVLIPVNQSFRQTRRFNMDIMQSFELGWNVDLTLQGIGQLSEDENIYYQLGAYTTLYDIAVIGVSNFSLDKTSILAGLQNLSFLEVNWNLMVSYSLYQSAIARRDNALEIFLSFQK